MEKELVQVIRESASKFTCTLPPEVQAVLQDAFDFEAMNRYLADLGVDVPKVPLGRLTDEKVKRGHSLLCEI